MGNLVQVALGIVVLLLAVGGLLYMFYARTNAVEKTGYALSSCYLSSRL